MKTNFAKFAWRVLAMAVAGYFLFSLKTQFGVEAVNIVMPLALFCIVDGFLTAHQWSK